MLAQLPGDGPYSRATRRVRRGNDEPGRRGHRRRIGDGARRRPAPRRPSGTAVALLDLDGDAAAAAAAEALRADGRRRSARTVDVTDRAAVDDAIGKVRGELGPVEIMVTSAGPRRVRVVHRHHRRGVGPHARGQPHRARSTASRPPIPDMLAAGWGRIVTISSSSAQSGAARMAHYVASKGGVIGLTKALARRARAARHHREHDPARVHRHADGAPGRGAAATSRASTPSSPARPVRRAGTPDDIAAACAFLCSDEAGYITGQLHRRQRRLVPVSDAGAPRLAPLPREQWDDDVRAALAAGVLRSGAADRFLATGADAIPHAERRSPR